MDVDSCRNYGNTCTTVDVATDLPILLLGLNFRKLVETRVYFFGTNNKPNTFEVTLIFSQY